MKWRCLGGALRITQHAYKAWAVSFTKLCLELYDREMRIHKHALHNLIIITKLTKVLCKSQPPFEASLA